VGKRIAIISVILLISGLAILGYFLQQGRKTLFTDPYKAISSDASIIIETIDLQSFFNSLTTGKGLFGEVSKVKEFEVFNRKIKYLADQLNKAVFKKIMNGSSSVISFHYSQTGRLQPLLATAVSSEVRLRQLKEMLRISGIKLIYERSILENRILEIPFILNNQKDTTFISVVSGLLICSTSGEIMKKAIMQTRLGNDVRDLPGFSRILLASGKNEDKIFVVFSNLTGILKTVFRKDLSGMAEKISRLAGSAGGDIYLSEDGLILSGYTESIDSSEYLYKYKFSTPGLLQIYKVLPSSTVIFESIVVQSIKPERTALRNISPEAAAFALKICEYTGGEITKAYIDIKGRPVAENGLIIYELKNRVFAENVFLDELSKADKGINISFFQPDDQIKVPIYLTPFKGFNSVILPEFAPDFDDSYFAFYDKFLITGSSNSTISRFLYDNLLSKTLANDLAFRDFESTLPSISTYFFYCVPSRITDYLAGYLNENIIKSLRSNKNSLNKIEAAGYQFAASNKMIYNSLSIRFKAEAREESTTEWETLLDTTAAIKPFFFTNHITGAREIFIQDMMNNAYLINAAGRVLWKVPLKERINGSIYMIDYFRNGKYQLLFSGINSIHMLDRNGNYVERYPVKLRSPATNSMALFDYDNDRTYRLLIAGEDKLIYSYDKSGNTVKGWKPFRTAGTVKAEICWFRVSGKDYLVASDETSVYFIDRTGNIRIDLKEPVTKAGGSAMRLNPGSEPSVVCTSPDGTIQHIYFDGSVKKFSLRKFSTDHLFDNFDVNGDGFSDYIFIDKGILYLYDHNRSELFTREFDSGKLGGPINFVFSASDRKIGVFDINKKLIYLIDKYGSTMNGFPLKGASMFSIGKLSEKSGWHLIVGGTDNFLYNYKLDTGY
jgi:hypothetical protein